MNVVYGLQNAVQLGRISNNCFLRRSRMARPALVSLQLSKQFAICDECLESIL
jgi:hypothetical protein